MDTVKEKILEELRKLKEVAKSDLKSKKFEDYEIKNIIYYKKTIKLRNKIEGKGENFELFIVITENNKQKSDGQNIFEIEYFKKAGDNNGEVYTIADLIHEYEGFENIKDVVDKTKENEEKPKHKRDKEYEKEELEELEKEKMKEEQEEKNESKGQKKEIKKRKPEHIIQTIDTNSYSDNIETIHRAFRLPANVKQIAFAYPNKEDIKELGNGPTIYMLDDKGNIVDGTKKYFKIDDATGLNPINDNNTELELDGTGERHEGKTMRRFRSVQRPDQYLSLKQKEVGQYNEVYADRKEETENSSIGNQVETRNVSIQTSLEMQRINSTYKGVFNPDRIDDEVDKHEEHGDDIDKASKENIDGKKETFKECGSPYIPGTNITWEELSNETKESITKLQKRFEEEIKVDNDSSKALERIIADYKTIEPQTRGRH